MKERAQVRATDAALENLRNRSLNAALRHLGSLVGVEPDHVSDFGGNNFEPAIIGLARQGYPKGGCTMRLSSNLGESNPFSEWTISAGDADARIARAIRTCHQDLRGQSRSGDVWRGSERAHSAEDCRPFASFGSLGGRSELPSLLREAIMRETEYYLAQAEFCAELAESVKRPDYKDRWLKTAQEWRDLARRAEQGGEASSHGPSWLQQFTRH